MPGGIQRIDKPDYRFVVKDDTLKTWGVWDKHLNQWVKTEINSSWAALQEAERLNLNPEVAYQ